MTIGLPHVLTRESLHCVNVVIPDECREEVNALKLARSRGVFSQRMMLRLCAFHALTQALKKPEHLGMRMKRSIYRAILTSLHEVNTYYETEAEAKKALLDIRAMFQ